MDLQPSGNILVLLPSSMESPCHFIYKMKKSPCIKYNNTTNSSFHCAYGSRKRREPIQYKNFVILNVGNFTLSLL